MPADYAFGFDSCRRLLSPTGRLPTAILAYNDLVAIGAIRAILDHGFMVPDDISVIGFDDLDLAQYSAPRLSTVSVSRRQMALQAIRMLIDTIESGQPTTTEESLLLPAELILRESTGAGHPASPQRKGNG
jgi:LacI family transcriptional regulator